MGKTKKRPVRVFRDGNKLYVIQNGKRKYISRSKRTPLINPKQEQKNIQKVFIQNKIYHSLRRPRGIPDRTRPRAHISTPLLSIGDLSRFNKFAALENTPQTAAQAAPQIPSPQTANVAGEIAPPPPPVFSTQIKQQPSVNVPFAKSNQTPFNEAQIRNLMKEKLDLNIKLKELKADTEVKGDEKKKLESKYRATIKQKNDKIKEMNSANKAALKQLNLSARGDTSGGVILYDGDTQLLHILPREMTAIRREVKGSIYEGKFNVKNLTNNKELISLLTTGSDDIITKVKNLVSSEQTIEEVDEPVELIFIDEPYKKPESSETLPSSPPSEAQQLGSGKADEGMYDSEINKVMKTLKIPHYKGCIAADEISLLKKSPKMSFVMNLDPRGIHEKEHWVACNIDIEREGDQSIEYYDPLGGKATKGFKREMKKYLQTDKIPNLVRFKENEVIEQPDNSSNCGVYCIEFLHRRSMNDSFPQASHYKEKHIQKYKNALEKFKLM